MGELILGEQSVIDTPPTGTWTLSPKSDGYYQKDSNGNEETLKGDKGDTGDTGDTGPQGPQGDVGPAGPAGPVAVLFKEDDDTVLTLPNTTTPQNVFSRSVNFLTTAEYVMQVMVAVRPFSTSNDMEFFWELDGTQVGADYVEEHKDSNTAQSNLRNWQIDLGSVSAGTKDIDLYFSKESTGGTAQLRYISVVIWKVS